MTSNVVLITIDALRSDFIGHLSGEQGSTPYIDGLVDDGVACTQAYANGIPTYFAFQSIIGGRCDVYSTPIGIPAEWNTVADVFSSSGYDTAAFNAANPWLTAEFNYDSGFDTFVDFIDEGGDESLGSNLVKMMQEVQHRLPDDGLLRDKLGLAARTFCSFTNNYPIKSADEVTARALDWLSNRDRNNPFFLWIHYMDPHYPWTPNTDKASSWEIAKTWHQVARVYNNSDESPDQSMVANVYRLYSSEVSNVDASIGKLLTYLEQQEMRDETAICLTADHGTELGDHGGFSHGPDSLYEEVVHVPLVLSGPDVPEKTITEPVQHVDIPMTLVDVVDIDSTEPEVELGWGGTSFLRQQGDSALVQVIYDYNPAVDGNTDAGLLNAIIDYPWKLHWNEHLDAVELYNLDLDPNEEDDLSTEQPDRVRVLKQAIRSKQEAVQLNHRTASEIVAVRQRINRLDLP